MRRGVRAACVAAFLLLCAGVWLFFQPLTRTGGAIPYLEWETCAVVAEDGSETPFDPFSPPPELGEGERFRFVLTLDGAPFYASRSAQPAGDGWRSNIQLTLLPGGGETLALEVAPREPLGVFPPMLQLSDDPTAQADTMAYANLYAIPAAAALVAYLALQRDRAFWRAWGAAALVSAGALLACWAVSALGGGYLARYLAGLWSETQAGYFSNLLYWITLWLEGVCALLSAWALVRSISRRQARLRAMEVKYALTVDNYRELSEKNRQTASLRHEWKNQLAALHLLQRAGDLEGLGEKLTALEGELGRLSERSYTRNPALNTIFQNAAYRAERLGVDFQGQVLVPERLEVDEGDLCALLLNLLDNALEGAARVPPPGKREIQCTVKLSQGFLAVWCRNTYGGALHTDEQGQLLTTKPDREGHGFGLAQMRAVAAKYHSVLAIDCDEGVFTVQTALKLPKP